MAPDQLGGFIRNLRRTTLVQEGGGMTDGQLLECFISRRDETAFEALVRRHGPMVLGVCRRVLRNGHDAEDAFQATFLVLVRKAASIGQRELVGNWLYGAAYRAALEAKALRRRVRERQVTRMPEPEVAAERDDGSEWRPILDQELNRLPDKYRVPVVLCDLEGRTRREVAQQLGIPDGTLSGRLTTARRLLAKRLARYGFALSGGMLAAALAPGAVSASGATSLVMATVQAATAVAAGGMGPGVVSAKVLALKEGVLKAMFLTKLKIMTVVLFGLVATGVGVYGLRVQTQSGVRADPPKQEEPKGKKPEAAGGLLKRLFALPDELIAAKKSDDEIVEALFRAALVRGPADTEKDLMVKQLKGSKDRRETTRDILWALVNSKEFGKLHELDGNPVGTLELLNKYASEWEKKTSPKDPEKPRPESRTEERDYFIVRLRSAEAAEAAKVLENVFRDSRDVIIAAEPRTNTVVVRASEKMSKQIVALLEELDRAAADLPEPPKPLGAAPPGGKAVLPNPAVEVKGLGGIVPLPGSPDMGTPVPLRPDQQVTWEDLLQVHKAWIEQATKKLKESKDDKSMREALQQLEEAVQKMKRVLESPLIAPSTPKRP